MGSYQFFLALASARPFSGNRTDHLEVISVSGFDSKLFPYTDLADVCC